MIDIKKAISGVLILSTTLEEVFNYLIIGKLPSAWLEKSYASNMSLGNYISDLCKRLNFFKVFFKIKHQNLVKIITKLIANKRTGYRTDHRQYFGYQRFSKHNLF